MVYNKNSEKNCKNYMNKSSILQGYFALFYQILLLTVCFIPIENVLGSVVINEIHYHPPSGDNREEFIELYNTGDKAINLEGWSLKGGVKFKFPNIILPLNSYIIIAADIAIFKKSFGSFRELWRMINLIERLKC